MTKKSLFFVGYVNKSFVISGKNIIFLDHFSESVIFSYNFDFLYIVDKLTPCYSMGEPRGCPLGGEEVVYTGTVREGGIIIVEYLDN